MSELQRKNRKLLLVLCFVAVGMVGVGYAFVPLYKMFCDFVGIPVPSVMVGKAGQAKMATEISDRVVTVRFMGNVAQGVPIKFAPIQAKVGAQLGVPVLTAYHAENTSAEEIDGVAVHTIVAMGSKGGAFTNIDEHIELQQCFCFEEQLYPANEEINLPLSFIVTSDLPEEIHTITFGYTLFNAEE